MKIIPQSFEPIIQTDDYVANIAQAARICYKSEDGALDDETPFVNGLVKGRHNSTLEMSVVHLKLGLYRSNPAYKALLDNNYIRMDVIENDGYFCTGSIRAWREFIIKYPSMIVAQSINAYLFKILPYVFVKDLPPVRWQKAAVSEFDPYTLPADIAKKHIHQGIKFITNRAVTHEFVRHRPCAFLQESQRYCMYSKEKFGKEVTFITPDIFNLCSGAYHSWYTLMSAAETAYINMINDGASAQAARTVLPNSCKTELIIYCSLVQWEHIFAMRDNSKCDPSMQEAIGPVADWFLSEGLIKSSGDGWKRSVG